MRAALSLFALALVIGCSAKEPESGWEYRPAHGAYAAWLYYRFGDGEGTILIGSCSGEPQFMIAGGAWEASQFRLTVDGKSWTLPTSQGEHGHYLVVDRYAANQAIAAATKSIAFQVGSWHRAIAPDEPLRRFVAACS
jgi:hypothetical protein